MHHGHFGVDLTPGQGSLETTFENEVLWDRFPAHELKGALILSSTVDAGNSVNTAILRPGLLMARFTSGANAGLYTVWSPTGTAGTDQIVGVLRRAIYMKDASGTARNRWTGVIVVGGGILSSSIIVPGNAAAGLSGDDYEYLVRAQMSHRFYLSDGDLNVPLGALRKIVAKTADYTVLDADTGTLFTTTGATGAVNFTLPAAEKVGLHYEFFNTVDQNMTVTAGTADTMVVFNDVAADSVSYSTSSEKIGGGFRVIADGTKWLVFPYLGADSQTITVVTA